MEEDDDDLYGTSPSSAPRQPAANGEGEKIEEDMESGEEEDSEDSGSDIEIVTEKTATEPATTSFTPNTAKAAGLTSTQSQSIQLPHQPKTSAAVKIVDPSTQTSHSQSRRDGPPILLPGDKYPAIRSSSIDVKNIPLWNGKPITELDIDADLAEQAKPWRRPGADQSDYFNYGFDEFTWSTYCMHQTTMKEKLNAQKDEMKSFENNLSSMGIPLPGAMPGMPAFPSAPTGPAAVQNPQMAGMAGMGGGMPSEQDMQQMFMQAMHAQGASDPSQLDFGAFMQSAMGGGMPGGQQQPMGGVPTGPSGGQQGQQGWGQQQGYQQQGQQQQGGRGGRGRGRSQW